MATTIQFRGNRAQLRELLRRIPTVAANHHAAQGMQLRIATALLSQIQQAFIEKARGGIGSDGIQWAPLKPETIAQRRTTAQERKAAGVGRQHRYRGLLTAQEDRRWRGIFASRLAWLHAKGVEGAAGIAAAIAWETLKREGAKTKLQLFGYRKVEIGIDTGRMFRSLSPGVEGQEVEGQVLRTPPGEIVVGTNLEYASRFHHGGRGCPARPLWPLNNRIPPNWWPPIVRAAQRGLLTMIETILRAGGRI